MAELIEHLADFYLQKKDIGSTVPKRTSVAEVNSLGARKTKIEHLDSRGRYISQPIRKIIHNRDQCCQWRDRDSKKICGSKYQLEVHHQQPVWADGPSIAENLQLLCRNHNAYTYRKEAQIKLL